MHYYQVGGLGSHTFQWFKYDTRALAEFVYNGLSEQQRRQTGESGTIELVLGVLSTGASYLLVTECQMDTLLVTRKTLRRPHAPRHSSTYSSLSPITFRSPEQLHAKLKTYEQNANKKKSGKAIGHDTSQANKMFDQYNPARASFEHQRILWSAIQNPIDDKKFGLYELPIWIASASLVALTLQVWKSDSIEKQRRDPTILSLELASIRCIAFREHENYVSQISDTIRVRIREHMLMSNSPSTSTNDATLDVVNKAELGKRLNDFFSSIDSKYALLLVYDAEQTLSALKKLEVDVSSYQEGIGTLLYGENRKQEDAPYSNAWGDHRDQHYPSHRPFQGSVREPKLEYRARSRSPNRSSAYPQRSRSPPWADREAKPYLQQAKEEEPKSEGEVEEIEDDDDDAPPPPAKVHVIDIRSHFLAVSRFAPGGVKNLLDLASRLGISQEFSGNECRLLIESWRSMASGNAIDEQHADRASSGAFAARRIEPMRHSEPAPQPGSDEEIDPNDVPINLDSPQRPFSIVGDGLRPHTDDYDSDDSDF